MSLEDKMEYKDDKIAQLKKEKNRYEYANIKGEGVFINDRLTKFSERPVNECVKLYIPEEFIEMPKEIQLMKFPSVSRPQRIFTSLDSSTNFTFSIVEQQTPDEQTEALAIQLKEIIRKSNPAAVYYQEESEWLANGRPISMFDFKNFGIDGQMYNMVCIAPLSCGTLHSTFICLEEDSEDWKEFAWEAFQTILEIDSK